MSLLRRIQDATVDPKFQLADVLRMCKILAARLDHPTFKEWIGRELNGYRDWKQVPDYRIIENLGCRGYFLGPCSSMKNAPISIIDLPEEFREKFREAVSTKYILQSVSALESIVGQANQTNKSLLRQFLVADTLALLDDNIYPNMTCRQAWTDIPTAAFVAVLDTVKSRILDFVIEIEAKEANAGDVEPGVKPIPDQTINYIFNKCILHHPNQTTVSRLTIQTHNEEIYMSDNNVNNFQGANVGNMANTVRDSAKQQANQHIHLSEQKQSLAESAAEIQQLLEQLSQTKPTTTTAQKMAVVTEVTEQIENNPTLKSRVISVLKSGGTEAFKEAINHPLVNILVAAIEGWKDAE
ncbi:MAG: hypothetical protein AB4080_08920 [Trichodesmium sp.]